MKIAEPIQSLPPGAGIWPLSVAAYRALGEAGLITQRTELINGVVYNKMSKSPLHSFLVMRLLRLLQPLVPRDCVVRCGQPVTCDDFSEPEPDVAIVRGTERDFLNEHPRKAELVIEVCVTSHDYDRSKLSAYAAAGVKEVWLVLAPEKRVEIYREPAEKTYSQKSIQGPGGALTCASAPLFTIELDDLFAK